MILMLFTANFYKLAMTTNRVVVMFEKNIEESPDSIEQRTI